MRKSVLMLFALLMLGPAPGHAADYIHTFVPEAEKVGQGRLTYLFWDVYDAALYAPQGTWKDNQPFALELSYLHNISGKKIADRSAEEMRLQGFADEVKLADWHAQMRSIFPDVDKGITLTGVYTSSRETVFYKDEKEIGRIADPEFGRRFFNIWLSESTSAPDLRRKLLGAL